MRYLKELKFRIYFVIANVGTTAFISYAYKDVLLFVLLKPNQQLSGNNWILLSYFIFTNITELFSVYTKIVFLTTLQVALFYFIYHILAFYSYASFKKEYFWNFKLVCLLVTNLILVIALFNYFIVPISWTFFFDFQRFISFNFIKLYFEPNINKYVDFCIYVHKTCLFYSQLFFLVAVFLNSQLHTKSYTKKFRKSYYFIFIFVATVVSPPEICGQIIVSLTFIILYELSVVDYFFKINSRDQFFKNFGKQASNISKNTIIKNTKSGIINI